jgi:hypothetical protein
MQDTEKEILTAGLQTGLAFRESGGKSGKAGRTSV